jgi:hypothetical protein
MKVMKLALLGTAALAAVSVSARADDLADLKAQIEALNSRLSQIEAAPAVPAGYQLLSVSEGPAIVVPSLDVDPAFGPTATTIGILPTADVPASTTIQWSGYARAALIYGDNDIEATSDGVLTDSSEAKDPEIKARGQLKVVGTTDTAVGEVGAVVQLRGNFEGLGDAAVIMNEAWGWWKMTPELTLGGGYTGSLSNIGYGYDGACNCYYTDNAPVALNPGDRTQIRLSYASGPLSFAIAVEDADSDDSLDPLPGEGPKDSLGAAGEIKYAGDSFSAEISAGWWGDRENDAGGNDEDQWQVGAGLGFAFDPINISIGAAMGDNGGSPSLTNLSVGQADYWKATILVSANLSDSVHAEVAYGYANWDDGANVNGTDFDGDTHAVLAGLYYDPVAQLTIGLEGEWFETDLEDNTALQGLNQEAWSVDLVTVFRF